MNVVKSADEKCIAKAEATIYKSVQEISIYKAEASLIKCVRIDRDAVDTIVELVHTVNALRGEISELRRSSSAEKTEFEAEIARLKLESSQYRDQRDQALEFLARRQSPHERSLSQYLQDCVARMKRFFFQSW